MGIIGWAAIAVLMIFLLVGIVVVWMQPPDDTVCECKPAKFCSWCGKRLKETRLNDGL